MYVLRFKFFLSMFARTFLRFFSFCFNSNLKFFIYDMHCFVTKNLFYQLIFLARIAALIKKHDCNVIKNVSV